MNQQILMLVLVVVVIGVISAGVMMSNSPETYTAAASFNPSKDIYIPGMKADGTIVLTHKFKDIDTAINTAAASIKTDYVAADAVVRASADTNRNARAAYVDKTFAKNSGMGPMMEWWMKNKYDPRYINKNKLYKIVVGPGQRNAGNNLSMSWGWLGGTVGAQGVPIGANNSSQFKIV